MKGDSVNAGVGVITPRYVVFEICELGRGEFGIEFPLTMRRRSELFWLSDGSTEELETALNSGLAWLRSVTKSLDSITISCCRPLQSINPADRFQNRGYGVVCWTSENVEWADFDLFDFVLQRSTGLVPPSNIFVHVDVAMGSLGEFHCRAARWIKSLKRSNGISRFGAQTPEEISRILAGHRLLYIKLSDTVEGFVCVGGRILPTANIPNYGSIVPRKLSIGGFEDPFPGICPIHGPCNTGLFGSKAIEARLQMRGESDFHSQPVSCPEERILVGYTAEMIRTNYFIHKSDSICLGGRLIDDRTVAHDRSDDIIDSDIPRQVWARLIDLLENDREHRFLPNSEPIFREPSESVPERQLSGDYVSKASCGFPAAFGGLVYSAQMYQSPTEDRIVPFGPRL